MAARGQHYIPSNNDGSDGAYRMTIEQRYTTAAHAKKSISRSYIPLSIISLLSLFNSIQYSYQSIAFSIDTLITINWVCLTISLYKFKVASKTKAMLLNIFIIIGMVSLCWNSMQLSSTKHDYVLSGLIISSSLISLYVFYHSFILSQAWNDNTKRE